MSIRLSPCALPPVALIANGFATQPIQSTVCVAVEAGVRWVHLRDHKACAAEFNEAAHAWAQQLRTIAPSVQLTVNTRRNVADRLGTGLHVGWRSPPPETLSRPPRPLGYSAHHIVEVPAARRRTVSYLTYSPIFPTQSKPGHPGVGCTALRRFVYQSGMPVYALGGITPERVAACRAAGAAGVAVASGILQAADPAEAAQAYQHAWADADES